MVKPVDHRTVLALAMGKPQLIAESGPKIIDLWVIGIPQPKGSARAFVVKGRPIITSDNPSLKVWEQVIRGALGTAGVELIKGPVTVELGFNLPIPKSRQPQPKSKDPLKRHPVPDTRPDLDKLIRSTLDACSRICFEDDGRVVGVSAFKQYALPVGVRIVVRPYPSLETT